MKNRALTLIWIVGLLSGSAWADPKCPDRVIEAQEQSGKELITCIQDRSLSWVVERDIGITVRLFENGTQLDVLEGLGEEVLKVSDQDSNDGKVLVLKTFVPPRSTRTYVMRRDSRAATKDSIEIRSRVDAPLGN